MEHSFLHFIALEISVNNLDEAIRFYTQIGFYVDECTEDSECTYAVLRLEDKDGFVIFLKEYYSKTLPLKRHAIVVDINEQRGCINRKKFDKLVMKGTKFEKLSSEQFKNIILRTGELSDPDGNRIKIIDLDV